MAFTENNSYSFIVVKLLCIIVPCVLRDCGGTLGYLAKTNSVVFQLTNYISAAPTFIYKFDKHLLSTFIVS